MFRVRSVCLPIMKPTLSPSASTSMKRNESLPTLVLIHDLLGSTREFDFIAPILTARGIRFGCAPIDGYSHGAGRTMIAWRDWVDAADAALDREHGSDAPIVLAGAGTGAALAAALALRPRRQNVAGVVMLASAFDCCARLAPRHRTAARLGLDRWIEIDQGEPFGVKNPKTRKAIARRARRRRHRRRSAPRGCRCARCARAIVCMRTCARRSRR